MEKEIKINFLNDYKSFQANTEYSMNGQLIILSGINGAGKSQLLEGIIQGTASIAINNEKIRIDNILKYSFKENISLPSFGEYDYEIVRQSTNAIISIYNTYLTNYKNYINMKKSSIENYELNILSKELIEEDKYCIENINYSLTVPTRNQSSYLREITKNTIFEIVKNVREKNAANFLDLTNEQILSSLPENFIIKFKGEEIDGITRIFTESARLRQLEETKYAYLNEVFNNDNWLKKAPWTEINKLFSKLNFNYRFSDDFKYEIPYLKEEPQLYSFENGKINKGKQRYINDLSDGEKAILKLVISTYDRKNDKITKLLLLDEYDATLNPSLINDFYIVIKEYYLNKGITVLLTTHSPITISLAPKEARYYEIFRQNDYSPVIMEVNSDDYQELHLIENYYNTIKNPALRLKKLSGEYDKLKEKIESLSSPLIITEGKTDWKHIKNAKLKLKNDDKYNFYEYADDMGDVALLNMLKVQSKIPNINKRIFIFDNDNDSITKQVSGDKKAYKIWENNVFSFTIPKPNIRDNEELISIEHYYDELTLKKEFTCPDGISRRIYCGGDFQTTGLNINLRKRCNKKNQCGSGKIRVLSGSDQEKVFDIDNQDDSSTNYALTKDEFFEKIIMAKDFENDLSKFNLILDIIQEIIELN